MNSTVNANNIDEEEASITIDMGSDDMGSDDDDDEYEIEITSVTNNKSRNHHPFFDSFVSVGVSVVMDDDDDDDDGNEYTIHDDDDLSKTPSMKSTDPSSNSSSKNKNSFTTTKSIMCWKQRVARYLFFGLLIVTAVLVSIVTTSFTSTIKNYCIAAVILILIGCIGIVFISYENLLKNREEMLVRSNKRSEAIVDSLFPEIVRDRILEEGGLVNKTTAVNVATAATENENVNNGNNGVTTNPVYNTKNSEKLLSSSLPPPPPPPPLSSSSLENTSSTTSMSYSSPLSKMRKNFKNSKNSPSVYQGKSTKDFGSLTTGSMHTGSMHSIPRNSISSSGPIADYFPSASIMFADIVGFTSWASVRDPSQVFTLLETVYGRFDEIAKKKGVFKVETIGDCYVAATGLPNPRDDHAIVMASFARRCLESMLDLISSAELEQSLGPGTNELGLRFGIHSGSVIGGVLRGAKSRYQLFGDTINTASRIESSSMKNKIHLSEQTAELLIAGGKKLWVTTRDEKVHAKGKGELQTYWLATEGRKNLTANEKLAQHALLKIMKSANIEASFCASREIDQEEKRERLVDYHTNLLSKILKQLVSMRDDESSGVGTVALAQLRRLVSKVAFLYREEDRPFYSFEHASHTVLSVTKLLSAIDRNAKKTKLRIPLLTQFVLIYATLVHYLGGYDDAPDTNTSINKQTSIERAWELLMQPAFRNLHGCICESQHELEATIKDVKSIMATSFSDDRDKSSTLSSSPSPVVTMKAYPVRSLNADSDSGSSNNTRSTSSSTMEMNLVCQSFPAGIVSDGQDAAMLVVVSPSQRHIIEILVQSSLSSHAMQHFSNYTKWNKLLFKETYLSYKSGTITGNNPTENWYEREIKFFDSRIVLAKQLRDCKVFNKVAEIYVISAKNNAREWEKKGKSIIDEWVCNLEDGSNSAVC